MENQTKTEFVEKLAYAPVRQDVVTRIFSLMNRNTLQPHGVTWSLHRKGFRAGHRNSSDSWGTGRAKARVPRVRGSGSGRTGQAAIANFARKGHMFSPILVWRRWHRIVPRKERNLAVVTAYRASVTAPLLRARGHELPESGELPIVVPSERVEEAVRADTSAFARQLLRDAGLAKELKRCDKSRKRNKSHARKRNRKYRTASGPLFVHHFGKKDRKFAQRLKERFGSIRGVDTMSVVSPNLLKLAPGGVVGRLLIWTQEALAIASQRLDEMRTKNQVSDFTEKKLLEEADVKEILKDDNVQKAFRKTNSVASELNRLMQEIS